MLAMSTHHHYREHSHGSNVPPAFDRIVSFNWPRTAVVPPRMVCYRHGA